MRHIHTTTTRNARNNWGNIGVWTLQVLLAALFLFAGGMKLVMPIEAMTQQIALPGLFLRFIGVCEVLGALGLILPAALNVRPGLTPLAALLLVPIMIGAMVVSVMIGGISGGVMPCIVGVACAFIALRRSKTTGRATARPSEMQTAG
jgi:uncharacterized membrane protein YphA (DoxX/SURF4 family)